MMDDWCQRTTSGSVELVTKRERLREPSRVISGYAAVFHRPGVPGTQFEIKPGIIERISRGAFEKTIREDDIRSMFNHNPDLLLGRLSVGTLQLSTDHIGLRYSVRLPNTTAGDDVLALVQRGDVNGGSFVFRIEDDFRFQEGANTIWELRRLKVLEAGCCSIPAYLGTTAKADYHADKKSKSAKSNKARRDRDHATAHGD